MTTTATTCYASKVEFDRAKKLATQLINAYGIKTPKSEVYQLPLEVEFKVWLLTSDGREWVSAQTNGRTKVARHSCKILYEELVEEREIPCDAQLYELAKRYHVSEYKVFRTWLDMELRLFLPKWVKKLLDLEIPKEFCVRWNCETRIGVYDTNTMIRLGGYWKTSTNQRLPHMAALAAEKAVEDYVLNHRAKQSYRERFALTEQQFDDLVAAGEINPLKGYTFEVEWKICEPICVTKP